MPDFYRPPESCQIPGLAGIYAAAFGERRTGTFVEVGAYDGETYSNTSFLADLGWHGLYLEPVPEHAVACLARHAGNPATTVLEVAAGATDGEAVLHLAGPLTTPDARVAALYGSLHWAKPSITGRTLTVPQRCLDTVLEEERFPHCFDLLVVDVEGGEAAVFAGFPLETWLPRLVIVELHEGNPDYAEFKTETQLIKSGILRAGYREIWRDTVNSIFALDTR